MYIYIICDVYIIYIIYLSISLSLSLSLSVRVFICSGTLIDLDSTDVDISSLFCHFRRKFFFPYRQPSTASVHVREINHL